MRTMFSASTVHFQLQFNFSVLKVWFIEGEGGYRVHVCYVCVILYV